MKYLQLFEEHTENLDIVLSSITEDNYEKILDYIGLDKDDYEIEESRWDSRYPSNEMYNDSELVINMNSRKLEKLMDIEDDMISYIQGLASTYNSYEYYVDDDELRYIHSYLSGDTLSLVKKLSILFDYKINPKKEGKIVELFEYLGLGEIVKDIKREIETENERAVEKAAQYALKLLPFDLDHKYGSGNKNLTISINYQEVIEYIQKHNLKIKTIKELFENVQDSDEFTYEIEYNDLKNKFLGDFEDVNNLVNSTCQQYIDDPDEIFPKLVQANNLELIKKKMKLANFVYRYDTFINYNKVRFNLIEFAINSNNSVLQWFKTYDFQKWLMENSTSLVLQSAIDNQKIAFKILQDAKILDSKIDDEYSYLVDSEKYNL